MVTLPEILPVIGFFALFVWEFAAERRPALQRPRAIARMWRRRPLIRTIRRDPLTREASMILNHPPVVSIKNVLLRHPKGV
jgi:hypothetical protein